MKSFFRFLMRNRLYSLINLAGLTLSLALVIIVFSFVDAQRRISKSLPDYGNTYAVTREGMTIMCFGIAERIEGLPECEAASTFSSPTPNHICEFQGRNFQTDAMSADRTFLEIAGVEFVSGGAEDFTASGILLSETFASRISSDTDPMGMRISVDSTDYMVEGVFKNLGSGLIPKTDIIINNEAPSGPAAVYMKNPLNYFGNLTVLVKLRPDADPFSATGKINGLFEDHDYLNGKLSLIRSDELYFSDANISLNKGSRKLIRNMLAAGLALLLLAVLNYVNLNTALVGKRTRELAIRRLLGSERRDILFRYITESGLFTALCFTFALLLAAALTPVVGRLTLDPTQTVSSALFRVADIFRPLNILYYLTLCLVTSVTCGIIPALLASRTPPVEAIKGSPGTRDKRSLMKIFIILQNAISITLITLTLTMEAQTRHMLDRPVGCDYTDLSYFVPGSFFRAEDRNLLMERFRQLPCVAEIGACNGLPGISASSYSKTADDGRTITFYMMGLDTSAFEMLGFNILNQTQECLPGTMWMTESTVRLIGGEIYGENLTERFIGGGYNMKGMEQEVCGVISDILLGDAGEIMEGQGAIVNIYDSDDFNLQWKNFVIRTVGRHDEALKMISETYEAFCRQQWNIDAGTYYNDYLSARLKDNLSDELLSLRLTELLMLLAILLSLSGLVAISIYYTEANAKSIAVHKVFGATSSEETFRNLRLYFGITLVAYILAVPVALVLCRRYLEDFSYRLELSSWIFIATVLISLAITLISVFFQVRRAAGVNPAETLKKE